MTVITEIADLKRIYRRRVPKMFYDYVETGSWTEQTFRENTEDFRQIHLRQRVAVDMTNRSTAMPLLGQEYTMPTAIAPIGMLGMQHADGEILAAQAAEAFGIPFTLSTMSICSIEDVAAHTTKPFWFQLYVMRDRDFINRLIDRAKAAGCSALVLTYDLQILGQRHKDLKNGLSAPPKMTLPVMLDLATKWRWGLKMLQTKRRGFGNIIGHVKGVTDMRDLAAWTHEQFDPTLNWNDIEWIKERWGGPLVLKGILDVEDARRAADSGADALVVSNHGGRQLDGAISSIRALPDIVDAVGDRIEVWMDGGIRTGQDILKAIALGARGVLLGRSVVYGLGAMGREGVETALKIMHKELDITMALCGERRLDQMGRHNLLVPRGFRGDWESV